jgi:hypothetical protein
MKYKSKRKLIDLLMEYGLSRETATAETEVIEHTLRFGGGEYDWHAVYGLLDSIDDPLSRAKATKEWLRVYLAETSRSNLAAWAGLQMYVGDSTDKSAEWLRTNGYVGG